MQNIWGFDDETAEGEAPYTYEPGGRVVPADGDPEVERYRASMRERERMRFGSVWMRSRGLATRRHTLRNWTITLAAVALIVLFIKPLAVVAAVVIAGLLGLLLLALLAAGALLLMARFTLGSRPAYHAGWDGAFRRGPRWHR